MGKQVIPIPTINDELYDFEKLFNIWKSIQGNGLDIVFDFSYCNFLRQNAVAFLGGVARLIKSNKGNVTFNISSMRYDVKKNLSINNFLKSFGLGGLNFHGNSVPYREDPMINYNPNNIMSYLKDYWLRHEWVHLSEQLKNTICGRIWEVYYNAFEHSSSSIGVFSCGQYYPRHRELKLSIADFGVGIPRKVKEYINDNSLTDGKALEWAFKKGNTTADDKIGRGLGLDFIKEFIKVNNGDLKIFSNFGCAIINKNNEYFFRFKNGFNGTLVNITIKCDERHYCLASEIKKDLF